MSQLGFPAITPRDPHKLGPYSSLEHEYDLTLDFAQARLGSSAVRLAREVAQHVPDGRAINTANKVSTELRRRERRPGRFDQRDRVHDLYDGAEATGQRVRLLVSVRHLYNVPQGIHDIEAQCRGHAALADTLDFVVYVVVKRLVPAMQNIVLRLSGAQRQEAGAAADRELRQFLLLVGRLRAVHGGDMDAEAARWKEGVGLFDLVLMQLIGLFERACLMAE